MTTAANTKFIQSAASFYSAACPSCRDGGGGRAVEHRTILQMLKPDRLERLANLEFNFCQERSCPVIYYSTDGAVEFTADDLREKVGLKMQGDPAARVCYCFGYTEGMIADELKATGQTTIPKKITQLTKTGMCACEVRNPAGVCRQQSGQASIRRVVGRNTANGYHSTRLPIALIL